jgi:FAD/FMN-containing dehydrogenase
MPNNTLYSERVDSYWSLTSQLTPECFVQPQDTKEVAAVVEVLLQETQCPFAIRSGGHSSTAGANNIEKAVTIDLGKAQSYRYILP